METKLSKLIAHAQAGEWREAIRIAAKFPQLGDEKAAIKRAHEAYDNGHFYKQIGKDPEALIAAGIAALKARYKIATLIGDKTMETKHSATTIDTLTTAITGKETKRANSKDAAIKRFLEAAAAKGIDGDAILAAPNLKAAIEATEAAIKPAAKAEPEIIPHMPLRGSSKAALRLVEKAAPEAPAKAAKPRKDPAPKADRPATGKRAAILDAAQRGEIPAAPDFSADTHKRFRAKLAEIVAAAEAGDLKTLKAFEINPVSSSPKAMAKYRDLAVIAIAARAAKGAAA